MPLQGGKKVHGSNIDELEKSGRSYKQAVAIELDRVRRAGGKVAPKPKK